MTDIVERFEHDPYDPYNMIRDPRDGEWVRYSDFAALSAKLAEAERERDVQRECKEHARKLCEAAEARVAELEKALATLADNWAHGWAGDTRLETILNVESIARAALAATKEPKP
jgi:hypothetical protein